MCDRQIGVGNSPIVNREKKIDVKIRTETCNCTYVLFILHIDEPSYSAVYKLLPQKKKKGYPISRGELRY